MLPVDRENMRKQLLAKCDELGIEGVRETLQLGRLGERKAKVYRDWLADAERRNAEAAEAEQREIDRAIARHSNRITFWMGISGNLIALGALAIAIYAALK